MARIPLTLTDNESHFSVSNLSNSGKVVCINWNVFTCKSESGRGL